MNSKQPDTKKKFKAFYVAIPVIIILAILIARNIPFQSQDSHTDFQKRSYKIPVNEVTLFDAKLTESRKSNNIATIKGKVKNLSSHPVSAIQLRVHILKKRKLIDDTMVSLEFNSNNIPPNSVRSFKSEVKGLELPYIWNWTYTVINVE
jgi:hypothetical protein